MKLWTFIFDLYTIPQVILALAICWVLCAILTACDVFSEDSLARTDGLGPKVAEANWFWIPYPGQELE